MSSRKAAGAGAASHPVSTTRDTLRIPVEHFSKVSWTFGDDESGEESDAASDAAPSNAPSSDGAAALSWGTGTRDPSDEDSDAPSDAPSSNAPSSNASSSGAASKVSLSWGDADDDQSEDSSEDDSNEGVDTRRVSAVKSEPNDPSGTSSADIASQDSGIVALTHAEIHAHVISLIRTDLELAPEAEGPSPEENLWGWGLNSMHATSMQRSITDSYQMELDIVTVMQSFSTGGIATVIFNQQEENRLKEDFKNDIPPAKPQLSLANQQPDVKNSYVVKEDESAKSETVKLMKSPTPMNFAPSGLDTNLKNRTNLKTSKRDASYGTVSGNCSISNCPQPLPLSVLHSVLP